MVALFESMHLPTGNSATNGAESFITIKKSKFQLVQLT